MKKVLITASRIYTPHRSIERGAVLIEGEKIVAVGEMEELSEEIKRNEVGQAELELIEAREGIVAPGFIDLHIHGGGGADVMDCTPGALQNLTLFLARHGTTGFLPTILAAPPPEMLKAIEVNITALEQGTQGAQILGLNLEGPFLNPRQKGALRKEGLRLPDAGLLLELITCGKGWVKIMTLAPELNGALGLIELLTREGITPAAGHTEATYKEMEEAVRRGLKHITHTFNAMRALHHREPGAAGAALTLDALSTELIADGVHVHPAIMKLVLKAKGCEKVALISDAMRAAGLPEGAYGLGGQKVWVREGKAKLADGTLAGSTLTLDRAVKFMIQNIGLSPNEALYLATAAPASIINVSPHKGQLVPGRDADLLILDSNWDVKLTMVRGKIVYRS